MNRTFQELILITIGCALLVAAGSYGTVQPSYAASLLAITGTATEPPTHTPTPVTPSDTPVTPSNTPVTPSNTPVTPSNTPVTPSDTPIIPPPISPTHPPTPTKPRKKSTPTPIASPTLTPTLELPTATTTPTPTLEPVMATAEPPTPTPRVPRTLPDTGDGGASGPILPLAVLGIGAISAGLLLHQRRRRRSI